MPTILVGELIPKYLKTMDYINEGSNEAVFSKN